MIVKRKKKTCKKINHLVAYETAGKNNGIVCLTYRIVSATGWKSAREKGYKWEEHDREQEGAIQPTRDKPGPLWEINAGI